MSDGHNRSNNSGGGSFILGLLAGAVVGAGVGLLFASKGGAELRNQLADQAGTLADQAQEGYRKVTENAGQWAEKGKEAAGEWAGRGEEAVSRGAEEVQDEMR